MSKYSHSSVDLSEETSWSKIIRAVPKGSNVLDIGCSSGYLGQTLIEQKDARVTGIELDPQDAKKARERGLNPVLVADIEQLDWSQLSDTYDVIVFADVLEHLKDPEGVLRRASEHLNKSGKVIISTPNIAHISIRTELMEGSFIYEKTGILDNTHLKYFTKETLLEMFKAANLHVTEVDATLYDLPEDLIFTRLKKIGLKPTEEFKHVMNTYEARAYQYIVTATPAGKQELKIVPLPEKLVMPHAQLVAERASLEERVTELEARLKLKDQELNDLMRKMGDISSSKGWRTIENLRRVYSLIKKIRKRR